MRGFVGLVISVFMVTCAVGWGALVGTKRCCSSDAVQECSESYIPEKRGLFRLATYATEDIMGYAQWSYAAQYAFAERHGYMLTRHTPSSGDNYENRDQRWNKIKLLRTLMDEEGVDEGSYVVWLDADLIVLDLDWGFEEIVALHPTSDLIASKDSSPESGLINTGLMLLRVCDWSRDFLDSWWDSYDRASFSEQGVFSLLATKFSSEFMDRVAIPESSVLNSIFDAWDHQDSDHKILHLAGAHTVLRAALFRFGFESICAKMETDNHVFTSTDMWLSGQDFRDAAGIGQWMHAPRREKIIKDGMCTAEPSPQHADRHSQLGLSRQRMQIIRRYIAQYLASSCISEIEHRQDGEWDVSGLRSLRMIVQTSLQMGFSQESASRSTNVVECIEKDYDSVIWTMNWVFNKLFELLLESIEGSEHYAALIQESVGAGFELLQQYRPEQTRERKYIMSRIEPIIAHLSVYRADGDEQAHLYYTVKFMDFQAILADDSGDVDMQLRAMEKGEAALLVLMRGVGEDSRIEHTDGTIVTRMSTLQEQRQDEMGRLLCASAKVLCQHKQSYDVGLEKAQEGLRRISLVWGPDTGRTLPPSVTDFFRTCMHVALGCARAHGTPESLIKASKFESELRTYL